ncbi:pirin family protein [Thiohalobacter sp.]|uniref:pirin family protein n=1 Tax=Thiohalobacter sp. TaxID=2025948 RepID=UPI00262669A0|nr:pirin family protein [Thiohalobacter sp.]
MDHELVQDAVETMEGAGVVVRRLFPVVHCRHHDPFVLWDHFAIEAGTGFPEHPHRGFEAITYLFDGGMEHADNLGNRSVVHAGGAQRFTAGRGIRHSEMPVGGARGIQLWINLPQRLKSLPPDYQQVDADALPDRALTDGRLRTIVGAGSPLRLHTPVEYLDLALDSGGHYRHSPPPGFRGLVYLVQGAAEVNGHPLAEAQALFLPKATPLDIEACHPSRLMLAFGRPHGEAIHQHGSYVD